MSLMKHIGHSFERGYQCKISWCGDWVIIAVYGANCIVEFGEQYQLI